MKRFCPPRSSDDLCLLFCIDPSSMCCTLRRGVADVWKGARPEVCLSYPLQHGTVHHLQVPIFVHKNDIQILKVVEVRTSCVSCVCGKPSHDSAELSLTRGCCLTKMQCRTWGQFCQSIADKKYFFQ